MAALNRWIESEFAWNLTNNPNEYVQQIKKKLRVIDMSEDAASLKKAVNGEIIKLQSRLFFDFLIRKNYTDR